MDQKKTAKIRCGSKQIAEILRLTILNAHPTSDISRIKENEQDPEDRYPYFFYFELMGEK